MLERENVAARPRAARGRPSASALMSTLPVAGAVAAGWAAVVGLVAVSVVVTLVWVVSSHGSADPVSTVEAGALVWLAGHHASISVASGPLAGSALPGGSLNDITGAALPPSLITLLPLGGLLAILALVVVAGRGAVRLTRVRTLADLALFVGTGAAVYALLAFLAAQLASLADATVEPLAALVAGALVAALGLAAGALWGIDVDVLTLVPPRVRHVTRFASLVLAALIGCGAALTALALIAHWSAVVVLTHRIAPSVGDACGLLVASLMYLPNLMVWAMSYLVGPGFSLGLGTAVNPFTATGAVLPPLPLLAAVPSPAPLWGPLLLLVPVGIGALGRIALRRRVPSSDLWDEVVVLIAGSGVVGVVMAMLCAVSGGSLGSGRLVGLGPTPWAAGLAAGALTAAGAVLAALLVRVLPTMWVHGAAD